MNSDPTSSAQDRWRDMVAATEWISEHPLVGVGTGNDILALNEIRGNKWLTVHNTYLNYGMDLGVPGMLLFVALLLSSLWSAVRVDWDARAGGYDSLALVAAAIAISLAGFALAGFFYPLAYHFSFYYLAGLAVALQTIAAARGLGRIRMAPR
jgi:O-antigen ligase